MNKISNKLNVSKSKISGFTLIEILVVIGIIAILAGIVLVAINPSRQFAQANNTQRTSNVNTILNAIGQYIADNKGTVPAGISTTTVRFISKSDLDICDLLMPTYVSSFPVDPTKGAAVTNCSSSYDTGYTVIQASSTKRITVAAPLFEAPATSTIEVTR